MLSNLTLKQKNRLTLATSALILIFTTYLSLALTLDSVYKESETMSKRLTESAVSVVKRIHTLSLEGGISQEEAQQEALNVLRDITYGQNGYIFVYSRDGTALAVGPKPSLEGNNYIGLEDPNGIKVIKSLVDVTGNGDGGFVHYHWERPGDDQPVPKVSYAQGFEPWDWLIGTGNYKVDMHSHVLELIKHQSALVVLALALFIALAVLLIIVNRSTLQQIISIKKQLLNFEQGDFSSEIEVTSKDEIGDILTSMKHLQGNMSATLKQFRESIDTARQGDLSVRIPLDNKAGAYRELSLSVNQLIEISENVVDDVSRVFEAMAEGKLDQTIDRDYPGEFDKLKTDANNTINALHQIINIEIQSLVLTATEGDLSHRIDTSDKSGFFTSLSSSINTLIDAVDKIFADLANTLESMADGNLNQPVTGEYKGSFNSLKDDANRTIDNIGNTVAQLVEAAEQLSRSSEEIDQGSSDLSNRTEQQAAALETTAASMEEISSMVQSSEDNAQQANTLVTSTRKRVEKGDEVVGLAISAMNDINTSSNKISEIIGVIDELAFQTNLLALNASVEAARAGEQGKRVCRGCR